MYGAHKAVFGQSDFIFTPFSTKMNDAAILPFKTDVKMCRNRFRYIIKRVVHILCCDLSDEIDNVEIERYVERERVEGGRLIFDYSRGRGTLY